MADIRDWGKFIRGRWEWNRFGYERGFPRRCGFTDIDAAIEFNGRSLVIEPKHWDGAPGDLPALPDRGQLLFLQNEVALGKAVLVLYGCGACNNPHAVYDVGRKEWFDWRGVDLQGRRWRLKWLIDRSMGLLPRAVD